MFGVVHISYTWTFYSRFSGMCDKLIPVCFEMSTAMFTISNLKIGPKLFSQIVTGCTTLCIVLLSIVYRSLPVFFSFFHWTDSP